MEWDVNLTYDEEEFLLNIDLDRYFEEFPDMKTIQIKIMGKKYTMSRAGLAKMIEAMEAI